MKLLKQRTVELNLDKWIFHLYKWFLLIIHFLFSTSILVFRLDNLSKSFLE